MGCDIHVRVEYFGRNETVVLKDGEVAVAAVDEHVWQPAERISKNKYRTMWEDELAKPPEQRKPGMTDEALKVYIEEEPEFTLNYEDRWYTGRNYGLFFKLAGVRGDFSDITPILQSEVGEAARDFHGRGLPHDLSDEVRAEFDEEDTDLHTRSWFTLLELQEADWSDLEDPRWGPYAGSGFGDTITMMEAVALEKCGGDPSRVRIVFAFDN